MTSPQPGANLAAAVILAAAAIGIVTLSLIASTEQTGRTAVPYNYDPADHAAGSVVVVATRATEGFAVLGFIVRRPEYHIDVSFTLPEECADHIEGDATWPIPDPSCAGPAGIAGSVGGIGRSAAGETIVAVAIETSESCYVTMEPGMTWPRYDAGCAS